MIRDTRELVSKQDFYSKVTRRLAAEGRVLSDTLTLREILEIFEQLPVQDELEAEWIRDGIRWQCSYCMMHALESFGDSFPSKRCPYCGRKMKMKV